MLIRKNEVIKLIDEAYRLGREDLATQLYKRLEQSKHIEEGIDIAKHIKTLMINQMPMDMIITAQQELLNSYMNLTNETLNFLMACKAKESANA